MLLPIITSNNQNFLKEKPIRNEITKFKLWGEIKFFLKYNVNEILTAILIRISSILGEQKILQFNNLSVEPTQINSVCLFGTQVYRLFMYPICCNFVQDSSNPYKNGPSWSLAKPSLSLRVNFGAQFRISQI